MKKSLVSFLVIFFVLVTSIQAESFTEEKSSKVIDNLSAGLVSDNSGLRVSSALVLSNLIDKQYVKGEKADKALISLMKMLNKSNSDEERISAALALYKIGNSKGIFKLRCAAEADQSPRVRKICHNLYCQYHKQNGTEYLISY